MAYDSIAEQYGGSDSAALGDNGHHIPLEYRDVVEHLFIPPLPEEKIISFTCALGVDEVYKKCISSAHESELLLHHFQKNMILLIAKIWVEKDDEFRKEKLSTRIQYCINKIKENRYADAFRDFRLILGELAYIFFGAQSEKDDFIEYAFRMDSQLGLFCWYGKQLYNVEIASCDTAALRSYLLAGICYLSVF